MRNLIVIGCGDIVRRALPGLLRRYRVYCLVRERDERLQAHGVVQIVGDLDRPETLRRLVGIAQTVLHAAPPPDAGETDTRTRHLLAALSRGKILPRHLVYLSTSGVYGDCGGRRIDETQAARPESSRGKRRLDAEKQLRIYGRKTGCRVSILRVPGIYATDRLPLDRLRRGLPVLREEEDVYTNHIHADDLAAICLAALERGRPNRIVHACDDTESRMGDWYDLIADRFGLARPPRVGREQATQVLSTATLSFMRESRRLDNRRLKRELKVHLRYPTVSDGLAADSNRFKTH